VSGKYSTCTGQGLQHDADTPVKADEFPGVFADLDMDRSVPTATGPRRTDNVR
jgi:hypothetical protein